MSLKTQKKWLKDNALTLQALMKRFGPYFAPPANIDRLC